MMRLPPELELLNTYEFIGNEIKLSPHREFLFDTNERRWGIYIYNYYLRLFPVERGIGILEIYLSNNGEGTYEISIAERLENSITLFRNLAARLSVLANDIIKDCIIEEFILLFSIITRTFDRILNMIDSIDLTSMPIKAAI